MKRGNRIKSRLLSAFLVLVYAGNHGSVMGFCRPGDETAGEADAVGSDFP